MLMVKIDPADKPSLRKNIDLTTAGLSAEEGRVATRIDGQTTVKDLCHLVSLPLPRVLEILDRLTRVRVVVWSDAELDAGPRPETVDVDAPNYGNFIFAPDLMMEDGDLSPEKRKQIIWYHAHLDRWSHYEILQVGRRAEAADVKRAFRERSMRWHPDRWPAKHRGSFQGLLEQIFARVQAANQVLSDPKRREEYDAGHIHMVADDDIAEMLEHHRREERERRREQEAIDRRKKRNPMRGRLLRAKELYSDAQKAHADGEVLKALGFAQMALAYEEREDYRELVDTLRAKAESMKLEPLLRRGAHYENLTHWPEAIELFEEAVRIAPDYGPARIRLAFNMLRGGRDAQVAVLHAQKGVQALPKDPEAHFVLGLCYDRGGKDKAAARALAKAVELKPNYKEAKKRLRELKWGF